MRGVIEGPARLAGDGVDTDVIAPGAAADFHGLDERAERALLLERAFSADPDLRARLGRGGILVAGRGFGAGSHRERANRVLPMMGLRAVVAESVARIFLRNAVALGHLCLEAPGITGVAREGEPLRLDLDAWRAEGPGGTVAIAAWSPRVAQIVGAGGMIPYIRARLGKERA